MASSYRDLLVWQKSMILTKQVYMITKSFPKEEVYGLTSQIRRCSISIPSNMAEGRGRNSDKEFVRFLQISLGSLYELQIQLELAISFNYISDIENILNLSLEIEKMLNKLITVKGGRNV
jgi:four helix bundle protein